MNTVDQSKGTLKWNRVSGTVNKTVDLAMTQAPTPVTFKLIKGILGQEYRIRSIEQPYSAVFQGIHAKRSM